MNEIMRVRVARGLTETAAVEAIVVETAAVEAIAAEAVAMGTAVMEARG